MTVPGNDIGIAGKAHDFVHDGLDKGVVIAAVQVGPADAAGKERVAGKEDARRLAVVADAAVWPGVVMTRQSAPPAWMTCPSETS